jgi:hypothetical protein
MIIAIVFAFCAASTFAVSTSVQHHATGGAPRSAGLLRLLGYLVRRPMWLVGQALGTAAFGLHALALHAGQLAVVQPIVISGIVWAVPARAAMSRRLPSRAEVRAVIVTAIGLAAFLVASDPTTGRKTAYQTSAVVLTVIGAAAAGAAYLIAVYVGHHPRRRALFYGIAAGVLFGMVAALLKMCLEELASNGLLGVLADWPLYGLIVAGAGGVLVNQRAYQTAGLSASMPVLNIADVITALLFGLLVFHEIPRHSPWLILVELLSLAAIGLGLVMLVRLEETFIDNPEKVVEHPNIIVK